MTHGVARVLHGLPVAISVELKSGWMDGPAIPGVGDSISYIIACPLASRKISKQFFSWMDGWMEMVILNNHFIFPFSKDVMKIRPIDSQP